MLIISSNERINEPNSQTQQATTTANHNPNHILDTPATTMHHHQAGLQTNSAGQGAHESLLLDKLQDMVPIMPRGRDLSELEVINYAIDYIRQLQEMVVEED